MTTEIKQTLQKIRDIITDSGITDYDALDLINDLAIKGLSPPSDTEEERRPGMMARTNSMGEVIRGLRWYRMTSNRYAKLASEIATSFELWGEYVDPGGTMSEEEFNALGIDERLKLMAEAFPEEDGEDDSSLFSPRNIDEGTNATDNRVAEMKEVENDKSS